MILPTTVKLKKKALLLSLFFLFFLSFSVLFFLSSREAKQVKNARISNVTGSSATISWITEKELRGQVYFGKSPNSLVLAQLLAQNSGDDRDSGNFALKRTTHHVTVTDLDPETTYYFKIGTDWSLVSPELDYFTTGALTNTITNPQPLYGKVLNFDQSGANPLDGIVYYSLLEEDLDSSSALSLQSAVLNNNSSWSAALNNIRDQQGESVTAIDKENLVVNLEIVTSQGATQDVIELGQNEAIYHTSFINIDIYQPGKDIRLSQDAYERQQRKLNSLSVTSGAGVLAAANRAYENIPIGTACTWYPGWSTVCLEGQAGVEWAAECKICRITPRYNYEVQCDTNTGGKVTRSYAQQNPACTADDGGEHRCNGILEDQCPNDPNRCLSDPGGCNPVTPVPSQTVTITPSVSVTPTAVQAKIAILHIDKIIYVPENFPGFVDPANDFTLALSYIKDADSNRSTQTFKLRNENCDGDAATCVITPGDLPEYYYRPPDRANYKIELVNDQPCRISLDGLPVSAPQFSQAKNAWVINLGNVVLSTWDCRGRAQVSQTPTPNNDAVVKVTLDQIIYKRELAEQGRQLNFSYPRLFKFDNGSGGFTEQIGYSGGVIPLTTSECEGTAADSFCYVRSFSINDFYYNNLWGNEYDKLKLWLMPNEECNLGAQIKLNRPENGEIHTSFDISKWQCGGAQEPQPTVPVTPSVVEPTPEPEPTVSPTPITGVQNVHIHFQQFQYTPPNLANFTEDTGYYLIAEYNGFRRDVGDLYEDEICTKTTTHCEIAFFLENQQMDTDNPGSVLLKLGTRRNYDISRCNVEFVLDLSPFEITRDNTGAYNMFIPGIGPGFSCNFTIAQGQANDIPLNGDGLNAYITRVNSKISAEAAVLGAANSQDLAAKRIAEALIPSDKIEPGVYTLKIEGNQELNLVVTGEYTRLDYYADSNGNGRKDANEVKISADEVQRQATKIADLERYNFIPGWNYIPINLQTGKTSTTTLLDQLRLSGTGITEIAVYKEDKWVTYSLKTDNNFYDKYGQPFKIESGKGYYLKSPKNSVFYLTGKRVDDANKSLQLDAGWNLVSFGKELIKRNELTAQKVLQKCLDNAIDCELMARLNNNQYELLEFKNSKYYGKDFDLLSDEAYLIKVKSKSGKIDFL